MASIASVHDAVLNGSGRRVVIKVQHKEVRDQLLQDLKCLETIGEVVRFLDPDFDFSPVVREWAKEVPKELDFKREAANMGKVAANLAPHYGSGIDVKLAELVAEEMVSERVLVMSFVDGFKIDNVALLDKHGVDRETAMLHITRAYAHQIFVDGFYSADPHPGNILVSTDSRMPVLLDFGLTKELTDDTKYNFARMIVAADEQDITGLLDSLEKIGLRLRTDQPFDLNLLVKYFFREAKPSDEAKKENSERRKEWKEREEERKKVLYAGDRVDVSSRNALGFRSSRKAEVIQQMEAEQLLVRLTGSGEELCVPLESARLQKSRSPIDSWPDAFIFFERVLGLLRGLCASLSVRNSYLDSMTPYARLALSRHPRSSSRDIVSAVRGLDGMSMTSMIEEALADGSLLGCQVCVEIDGKAVVDLCAGALEPYHMSPVAPDSVFCGFSVSKGVAAAAVHMLAQEGLLDLHRPISEYWPAFAAGGKGCITLNDVLAHRAGMQLAGTSEVAADPFLVCDAQAMRALMASYEIEPAHDGSTAYHYLSLGWILDGAVFHATGRELREVVRERIGDALDLGDELLLGIDEGSDQERVASLVLQRLDTLASASSPAPQTSSSSSSSSSAAAGRPPNGPSLLLNPTFFNNKRIRSASSLCSANGHFSARALAKLYSALCTDRLFPGRRRGLADILRESIERGRAASGGGSEASGERMLQGGAGRFLSGFMLYPSSLPPGMALPPDAAVAAAVHGRGEGTERRSILGSLGSSLRSMVRTARPSRAGSVLTFGHSGLGGSVALVSCDIMTGRRVSLAVTVNRLSMDSAATRRIVRHIYSQLNMPVPLAFQR